MSTIFLKPSVVDTSDLPQVYMNLFTNNSKNFKTISEWNDSSIRFYIVDNENNIFKTNVNKQSFEPQADKLKLKLNDYLKELQLIFSKNKQNYVASLLENQFSIKRILSEEDEMYEKFCDINLSKVNSNDVLFEIWNLMLKVFYNHKNENEFQRELSERLKEEQQKSTQKLEEIQTIWENEKKDLKHKFLLLLNEKKDRILELRDLLEDSMQSRSIDSMKSSSARVSTKRKREKCDTEIKNSPENVRRNSSPDNLPMFDEDSNESITDEANLAALQSLSTTTCTTINEPQPSTSKLTAFEINTKAANNQPKNDCSKTTVANRENLMGESQGSENLLGESQEAPIIEVKRNRREENVGSNVKLSSDEHQNKTIGMKDDVTEGFDDVIEDSFDLNDYLAKMRN